MLSQHALQQVSRPTPKGEVEGDLPGGACSRQVPGPGWGVPGPVWGVPAPGRMPGGDPPR